MNAEAHLGTGGAAAEPLWRKMWYRMLTVIDILWHALDRVPSVSRANCRPRGSGQRKVAGPLQLAVLAIALALGAASTARAANGEIRIGNTIPYSGPAAAYGIIGKTIAAFFNRINDQGGINGRRISFISYDDSYNPQQTVELTRKLVEEDKVLLIFASLGTAPNAAARPYLNSNKVPQLFVSTGSSMWDNPKEFPWTMGFQPSYQTEGHVYAQYLLETHPRGGKIAILYQDDDFGKDYVKGMKDGLGGKIQIVAEAPYKITDANVNQQLATLKASGADIFFDVTTPKFAAMVIRRIAEIGWKPEHIIPTVSESVTAVMQPAGLQNSEGILSVGYYLEGDDTAIGNDPGYRDYAAFMDRYMPDVSKSNGLTVFGYVISNAMVEVLKKCDDDVSRENVMKQAASLKGVKLPMLAPGVEANTSAADYAPLEQMQMMQFRNGRWERFGPVRSGIDPGAVSDSFKTIFRYGNAKRALADQLNANTVTLMAGSFGSTSANMGADLASVLDSGADLRILPVMGRGSVQAVADILLLRGVDVGIVRKDTLAYLDRKDYASNIRNQFVYITKMFNEEMHVLAPQSIHSMKELDGKTLQWLAQVNDTNLHLVPVDYDKSLRDEYLPAQFSSEDYPNLVSASNPVDTIAGEAVLASYNWQPGSDRYHRLALLVESLFSRMAQLQRPPFHPKWQELAPLAPVAGWTRFKVAQDWVDRNAPVASNATPAAFGARASGPQEEDPALYREFLEWRANRVKQPPQAQPQRR